MRTEDPLERAFEFMKADSTEWAINTKLETRLMNEFQKQNRPARWKRVAWAFAALVGIVFASGGLAAAAGYHPFGQFIFMDEQGNTIDFQAQQVVQNDDGSITITGTAPQGNQAVQAIFVVDQGNK